MFLLLWQLKMSDSNRASAFRSQYATLLHHILSNPSGNRTRASGATVRCTGRYTMELNILLVSKHIKSRLSFRTSGSLSTDHCNSSGYPAARAQAPGPRHPLDPVLLRHTQISPSACFAVGIIVPWRSNRRYVFLILFVYICSIAFPFPDLLSFFP